MKKIVVSLVLGVVVFLTGFLPQYFKAARLEVEVAEGKQHLESCESKSRLSELRDLAALMYLEASQKNYTVAGGYSTRFFDQIRQAMNQTADPKLKHNLQEILDLRDAITAGLARGEAGVVNEVQTVLMRTHGSTKS